MPHVREPLGGAAPILVFTGVEGDALLPSPHKVFVLAAWSTGVVGPDILLCVGKDLCSLPWRRIGRRVDARAMTDQATASTDPGELGHLDFTHVLCHDEIGRQRHVDPQPPWGLRLPRQSETPGHEVKDHRGPTTCGIR